MVHMSADFLKSHFIITRQRVRIFMHGYSGILFSVKILFFPLNICIQVIDLNSRLTASQRFPSLQYNTFNNRTAIIHSYLLNLRNISEIFTYKTYERLIHRDLSLMKRRADYWSEFCIPAFP